MPIWWVGIERKMISDNIYANTLKIQTCTQIKIKYLECWKEKQSFVFLHLYSIQFKIGSKNYKLRGNCYVGSWRLTPNYRPSLSWSSSLIYSLNYFQKSNHSSVVKETLRKMHIVFRTPERTPGPGRGCFTLLCCSLGLHRHLGYVYPTGRAAIATLLNILSDGVSPLSSSAVLGES